MSNKIPILLIIVVVLGIGGLFVYKNIFVPEREPLKESIPHTFVNEICLKISQSDDFYYCLAVANQDISFCQNLDIPNQRKLCKGMATRDISYCREIQEPEPKKMCYYELGFLTGEFSYCDEVENSNDCYFAFVHRLHWESRNNEIKTEYCEKLNIDTPEGVILKNCCLAFKEQDPSLCKENKYCLSYFKQPLSFCDIGFETPEGTFKYRDDCLVDRAMSKKDPSLCAEIQEEELKDLCYGNMSTHIFPDLTLCDKIVDEKKKTMCYVEYAIYFAQKEHACLNSGGVVGDGLCCESASDFPDTCAIGTCGCAPKHSHQVKICNCGENKCYNGIKCVDFGEHLKERGMLNESGRQQDKAEEGPEQKEQFKIPLSYYIEDAPYYREDGFCWGASAIMLMMYEGFLGDEIQEFRTVLKSGLGGPPDMFRGFVEFGLIDRVRVAYSRDYNKQFADFYNQKVLTRPEQQVVLLEKQTDALDKLKELISSDVLVMIMGHHGNHYMVVTGYDENYIYINDPGKDDVFFQKIDYEAEYQEKTKMSLDRFFEQWNVSDFEGGGVGFPGDYGMIWFKNNL